uniref:Uncharacterized protein n=1 Tax=Trichogramma kaykai TaxID=54128 RepID=A0ABD2XGG8_9HYME
MRCMTLQKDIVVNIDLRGLAGAGESHSNAILIQDIRAMKKLHRGERAAMKEVAQSSVTPKPRERVTRRKSCKSQNNLIIYTVPISGDAVATTLRTKTALAPYQTISFCLLCISERIFFTIIVQFISVGFLPILHTSQLFC